MTNLIGSQGLDVFPKLIEPFYSGVLLQLVPQKTTKGGLALPDRSASDASDEAHRAWVIAAGEECKYVQEGDLVILGNMPMMILKHEGYQYVLTTEDRLAGRVLNPDKTPVRRSPGA